MDTPVSYGKFEHPEITAKGEMRAHVALKQLVTLWFNTGSLCNITCQGCYMESSPRNDALAYIRAEEVRDYLNEISQHDLGVREIGLTGGEPFMNPEIVEILSACLESGFEVLVLSNAMKPMAHKKAQLLALKERFGDKLALRISMDHYRRNAHEALRGENSWASMLEGLTWLASNKFRLAVAGRTLWEESEDKARQGYAALFQEQGLMLDAFDPAVLVLFPEMDEKADVPEITVSCWDVLGLHPDAMMCATSRMVVKRKGAKSPAVVPCTLLPYDEKFEMGTHLQSAGQAVRLNHPHCAKFCVLGGGSCSQA